MKKILYSLLLISALGLQTQVDARPYDTAKVEQILAQAHTLYKDEKSGANADYIPALAKVDSEQFAIALVTTDGKIFTQGDIDSHFSIQSISKVFTLALAMEQQGPEAILDKIGANATGLPFNSVTAIELNPARSVNPLVNAGAMATVSLIEGDSAAQKWQAISAWYGKFATTKLDVLEDVYRSESSSNGHNLAIAELLKSYGRFYGDVDINLDIYTRQCSVGVTTKDLAIMASVFANGGTHPISGAQLMRADNVERVLAVMSTAGLYETSGEWAYTVGLPAKSGVGGGIIAIMPGKFAIAAFSPRLDAAGNSVRAQKAIDYIADKAKANIFSHLD
ncbi:MULTISPECIES: glutaminase A [unclassified Pseudoalteromonas]|uniref:glutaminase A n=1 Tax=unclassified Pseudoalteromonas TaxID=194690 RepID=UPI000CF63522|nr:MULTISPECIES: glutaminase A [unclassified Pseudoalteromonas]